MRVECLVQEDNIMFLARAQTQTEANTLVTMRTSHLHLRIKDWFKQLKQKLYLIRPVGYEGQGTYIITVYLYYLQTYGP